MDAEQKNKNVSTKSKKDVSTKVHTVLVNVHRAFIQPRKDEGQSLRKQYWLEAWEEIKRLSPAELVELNGALETIRQTLKKLRAKVDEVRTKKLKARAERHSLEEEHVEEDEFLDSSAALPIFKTKEKFKGKKWVITKPIEKPKTVSEICQAVWTVITNRAIYIVDKGATDVEPSPSRDMMIDKHRLSVLPSLLDDKIITDTVTGKPLMNLYMINTEVKETLLWLLAERAKTERNFRKIYMKFLEKDVIKKASQLEWAKKFSIQAHQIMNEIADL